MSATLASLAKEEEVPSKSIDTLRAIEDTPKPKTLKLPNQREKKMIKIEKTLNEERTNLNNVILEEFEGEKKN